MDNIEYAIKSKLLLIIKSATNFRQELKSIIWKWIEYSSKNFIKWILPCEYYAGQRTICLDRRNIISYNLPFCDCYESRERFITGCYR